MLISGIILFCIAIIFGAILLTAVLRNQTTPKFVVLMHGAFAGIALLITIVFIATGHTATLLLVGLGLLILAALGGFTMLAIDLSNKPIPKAIALLHPLAALAGVISLIVYAVNNI